MVVLCAGARGETWNKTWTLPLISLHYCITLIRIFHYVGTVCRVDWQRLFSFFVFFCLFLLVGLLTDKSVSFSQLNNFSDNRIHLICLVAILQNVAMLICFLHIFC